MANRSERLRKAYEFKLGKDVASKLSDEQIQLISGYYSSLSKDEQSQIDIDIFMGKKNDLSEMASSFIEENDEPPVAKATATATKEKPKGALVPVGKSGEDLVDEKIDERILRIIGLEDVFDIDYDTYISLLKEQSVLISTGKSKIPREEEILIQDEFKRVKKRKGKGRFKVSKITAASFKKGTAVGLNLQKLSAEVNSPPLMLSPAMESAEKINEIVEIKDALKEIIGYLTQQNKDAKKKAELDRRSAENRRRAEKESALEKGSGKVMKIAEKILAPVKSLLQRIIDFITAVFFGRALIKLIDWLANPENKTKIDSILRFLGDHWPALLALYLRFGTGLGKFVGAISNIIIKGGIRLAALAAQLLVKAGVGKAAGAAKFLGGRGGRLLGAGLQVAATVGSTLALSSGIENFDGIGGDEKQEPPKVEGRVGGGVIKIPKFSGGGFNFGGFGNFFNGLVSGQKGVDKIPAMLSDGEFVMSAGAVRKHGVGTLEAMNAAGGGTNKPKMVTGIPHAAGGGLIGRMYEGADRESGGNLKPVVDEIIRGLSSQYKWANDLARKTGVSLSGVSKRLQYEADRLGNKMPSLNIGGHDIGKRLQYETGRMGNGVPSLNIGGHDIGKRLQYETGRIKGLPGKLASKFNNAKKDDMSNVLGGLGRSSYRDAGMVYARSMLGGIGGNLTEKDFSPENQKILEAAIKRAQSRQQQKLEIAMKKLAEKPNDPARQSAVRRLQQGQIQLGYEDYATDKKGKDLKNILGQAWFQKQKDGGYRSTNEKYNFQKYKNPWKVALGMTDEENKNVKKSGVNFQKRLEALHQINPLARDLDADVMIGGKRSSNRILPRANISSLQRSNVPKITPPSKQKVQVIYSHGTGGARTKADLMGGATPKVPSFSASHPSGHSRSAKMLGIK